MSKSELTTDERLLFLANKAHELQGQFCVIPILCEMVKLRDRDAVQEFKTVEE